MTLHDVALVVCQCDDLEFDCFSYALIVRSLLKVAIIKNFIIRTVQQL